MSQDVKVTFLYKALCSNSRGNMGLLPRGTAFRMSTPLNAKMRWGSTQEITPKAFSSMVAIAQKRCLCSDDEIVGVGFAWDNSDERKLKDSFGLSRKDLFKHFVDVNLQAQIMGYHNFGVTTLSKKLLGFQPPSSKAVRSSSLLMLLLSLSFTTEIGEPPALWALWAEGKQSLNSHITSRHSDTFLGLPYSAGLCCLVVLFLAILFRSHLYQLPWGLRGFQHFDLVFAFSTMEDKLPEAPDLQSEKLTTLSWFPSTWCNDPMTCRWQCQIGKLAIWIVAK